MKNQKYKYMHLINGEPGQYIKGQQICYRSAGVPVPLVDSLSQIREEQRATKRWRKRRGFTLNTDYGHCRVAVP